MDEIIMHAHSSEEGYLTTTQVFYGVSSAPKNYIRLPLTRQKHSSGCHNSQHCNHVDEDCVHNMALKSMYHKKWLRSQEFSSMQA